MKWSKYSQHNDQHTTSYYAILSIIKSKFFYLVQYQVKKVLKYGIKYGFSGKETPLSIEVENHEIVQSEILFAIWKMGSNFVIFFEASFIFLRFERP